MFGRNYQTLSEGTLNEPQVGDKNVEILGLGCGES